MLKKKLLVDGLPLLTPLTGVGRYTYEIAKALERSGSYSATYFYGYYSPHLVGQDAKKGVKSVKSLLTSIPLAKRVARRLIRLRNRLFHRSFDLYWQPNFIPDPAVRSRHTVVTVHDFSFHLHPEWHPRERYDYFREHFWDNIGRAERIITVSEYIKGEIVDFLKVEPARVEVIHNGVDHQLFRPYPQEELDAFRKREGLPERFILFVGSIEPRKNLYNLLKAYHALDADTKRRCPLLLAGFKGWENREIMEMIEADQVRYLGYLEEVELAYLYNLATLFVYPSFYEGFGMPPLEAMACGTPVIASGVTAIPEACGDAALYCDPNDAEDLRAKIVTLLSDETLQKEMAEKGLRRSSLFSWERSAAAHDRVFRELLAQC